MTNKASKEKSRNLIDPIALKRGIVFQSVADLPIANPTFSFAEKPQPNFNF